MKLPALAHFGMGFAFKRIMSKVNVVFLLIACFFIDIVEFFLMFLRIYYPGIPLWISHGLFMGFVWSILGGSITALCIHFYNKKREKNRQIGKNIPILYTSIMMGLLILSHTILDIIGWPMTAFGDSGNLIPLVFNDSQGIGLGLYSTIPGALIADIGIFLVGLTLYILLVIERKKKRSQNPPK